MKRHKEIGKKHIIPVKTSDRHIRGIQFRINCSGKPWFAAIYLFAIILSLTPAYSADKVFDGAFENLADNLAMTAQKRNIDKYGCYALWKIETDSKIQGTYDSRYLSDKMNLLLAEKNALPLQRIDLFSISDTKAVSTYCKARNIGVVVVLSDFNYRNGVIRAKATFMFADTGQILCREDVTGTNVSYVAEIAGMRKTFHIKGNASALYNGESFMDGIGSIDGKFGNVIVTLGYTYPYYLSTSAQIGYAGVGMGFPYLDFSILGGGSYYEAGPAYGIGMSLNLYRLMGFSGDVFFMTGIHAPYDRMNFYNGKINVIYGINDMVSAKIEGRMFVGENKKTKSGMTSSVSEQNFGGDVGTDIRWDDLTFSLMGGIDYYSGSIAKEYERSYNGDFFKYPGRNLQEITWNIKAKAGYCLWDGAFLIGYKFEKGLYGVLHSISTEMDLWL